VRSIAVFWGAFLFSVVYLSTLYLVVALAAGAGPVGQPVSHLGRYLGFFQALVVAAIGKFFIENVH
jgi:hypothetical protein